MGGTSPLYTAVIFLICQKMENKIILAVAMQPVLFDQSMYTYRDTNRSSQAWRVVAETVGETEEVCRTQWKSLWDRFLKEKAKEKEAKRSGAGSSGGYKPWRFTAVMGFLTPFIFDRETSSNVPRQTLPPSNLVPEEESQESQLESQPANSQPANSQQAQAGETGQEEAIVEDRERGKRRRRRGREMSSFEKELMSAISPWLMPPPQPHPPPPPPVVVLVEDQDELFFKSLLPSMRRLSISKRARVRFEIHKAIFEAEQEMEEN